MVKNIFLLVLLIQMMSCEVLPTSNSVYPPWRNGSQNSPTANNEKEEFSRLLEKDKINKKRVNAEVLTYLLNDTDPADTRTAAVIENTSRCNIIIRMIKVSTHEIYNLPVAAQSKNQFVIQKGRYTLKSNVCGANYYSQKELTEPLILKLSSN